VKVLEFFRFSRNFAIISRISPKIPQKFWKLSDFSQIFTTISPYFPLIQRWGKSIDIDLHSLSEEICHWLNNFQLRSSRFSWELHAKISNFCYTQSPCGDSL
jgi:hypothetical protein